VNNIHPDTGPNLLFWVTALTAVGSYATGLWAWATWGLDPDVARAWFATSTLLATVAAWTIVRVP
jgi:hypothetical protein